MSKSGKITAVGKKISTFVTSKGVDPSKVDDGISKSNKVLEDLVGSDGYGEAADATLKTLGVVLESIDNFESGDPNKIAIGVLNILAEVSAFAALTGPKGKVVAALLGPLCTIISSLLGAGKEEGAESDEDMMKRVIEEALAKSKYEDYKDTAIGVTTKLNENMQSVELFLSRADTLTDETRKYINDPLWAQVGAGFIGKLESYIRGDIKTKNVAEAGRTAALIVAYSSVVFVRCRYLYTLSCLIGTDPDLQDVSEGIRNRAENLKATCTELLIPFLTRPDASNQVVFSQLYLQPQSSLDLLQALCDKSPEGKVMAIYNTKQNSYLHVDKANWDDTFFNNRRSIATVKTQGQFWSMSNSKKFVVFWKGDELEKLEIFSIANAGYVYASGGVLDDDRRYVTSSAFGYSTTNENGGCWGWFVKERTVGSIYLRNTYFPEYMYAADYGASGDTNPVYTWRPGNRVSQGHWIFEDLVSCHYNTAATLQWKILWRKYSYILLIDRFLLSFLLLSSDKL